MNLDELERLEREATAGPWSSTPSDPRKAMSASGSLHVLRSIRAEIATVCSPQNERNTSNAALIAALRNSARELIADARRYRWLKERLHGVDFNYMDADNRANSVIVFEDRRRSAHVWQS